MIVSFKDHATEHVFHGERVKKFAACERQARRKLEMLAAATNLQDLKIPPGNKLEQLQGKWYPRYSIRINDQWRIRFLWLEHHAAEVEIVDYH